MTDLTNQLPRFTPDEMTTLSMKHAKARGGEDYICGWCYARAPMSVKQGERGHRCYVREQHMAKNTSEYCNE